MVMASQPSERAARLRSQIEHHNRRYCDLDDPEISDAEDDSLIRELQALEESYPDLRTAISSSSASSIISLSIGA